MGDDGNGSPARPNSNRRTSMMNKIESKVVARMQEIGGSFAKHLAALYVAADPVNRERIQAAFPEIWESYLRLVLKMDVQND